MCLKTTNGASQVGPSGENGACVAEFKGRDYGHGQVHGVVRLVQVNSRLMMESCPSLPKVFGGVAFPDLCVGGMLSVLPLPCRFRLNLRSSRRP